MSPAQTFIDAYTQAMAGANNGIVGLVDVLLNEAVDHALKLEWRKDEGLAIISPDQDQAPSILKVRPSVMRSILARIATICNEHSPESVSPYGGATQIPSSRNPNTLLIVRFQNTTTEQNLTIIPMEKGKTPFTKGNQASPQLAQANGLTLTENAMKSSTPAPETFSH